MHFNRVRVFLYLFFSGTVAAPVAAAHISMKSVKMYQTTVGVVSPTVSSVNDKNQMPTKKEVSGVVKDANGEFLIGVSVLIKGAATGTITNPNGRFTIQAAKGEVLEFSYIGYATKSVVVGDGNVIDVLLKEDYQALDEVVVTALGIKRAEKALSYNIQKVDNKEFTAVLIP